MVSKPAIVGVVGGVAILTALGLNFWIVPGDEEDEVQRVVAPAVPRQPAVPSTTDPSAQGTVQDSPDAAKPAASAA